MLRASEKFTALRFPVLLIVATISVPLSLFAPKALLPLMLLVWLPWFRFRPVDPATPAFFALVLFILWSLFESFRAHPVMDALQVWARAALTLLCGAGCVTVFDGLTAHQQRLLSRALVAGITAGLLCAAIELLSGDALLNTIRSITATNGKPTNILMLNRGACFLALAVWPAILAAFRLFPKRPYLAGGLLLGTFCVVLSLESSAAMLALAAGLVAFGLAGTGIRPWNYLPAAGIILVMAFSPAAMLTLKPENYATATHSSIPISFLHRMFIWQFASSKAMERPLLGHGMNASRHIEGGDAPIVIGGVPFKEFKLLPGHTHNSVLQVWLELGGMGLLIYIAMAATMLLGVVQDERLPRLAQGTFTAMLTSFAVISMLSFGLWQEWWMAAGFLAALFTRAIGYPSSALASAQNAATSSDSGLKVGSIPA